MNNLALALLAIAHASAGGLTMMEKDMLCICRNFRDPSFPRPSQGETFSDDFCESISFHQRWESMFPTVELGVGIGGLRGLVFTSKLEGNNNVVFAFREFLHDKHDYYVDDDFWQEYSMTPGVSFGHRAMLYTRHYLGFDYFKHACGFVDQVLSRGKVKRNPIFTGYGFGGTMAMLQALRFDAAFAVTFSAPADVRAVAHDFWYLKQSSKRVVNLVLDRDERKFDSLSLSAVECTFATPDTYSIMFGDNVNSSSRNVFSNFGFVALTGESQRRCRDP